MSGDIDCLFQRAEWGDVSAVFERNSPPEALVSNVNLVPYIGDLWVAVRLVNGRHELPGGKLEANESVLDGLRRELMEEAGAEMLSFTPLGAWRCHSSAAAPYRPYLPHPDFYRLVGCGEVKLVASPTNPTDGEQVAAVEALPLDEVARIFRNDGRPDIAGLYGLAAQMRAADRR